MNFLNIFGRKKQAVPEPNGPSPLEQITEAYAKERGEGISIGKSLFPLVRSAADPRFSKNRIIAHPFITSELAEGIIMIYGLDIGDNFEIINENHCERFSLTKEDLMHIAKRNLLNKTAGMINIEKVDFSENIDGAAPFYRARLDDNLDTSLMLIDEFWEHVSHMLKTDVIAVSLPARNVLYFAAPEQVLSFRAMRPVSKRMYESSKKDGIEITPNTYIRKKGKWVLFRDTEEQLGSVAV
jgi:uncharacterized protein YtpQ (UPF0354 family)